jgi:hypothetical protein
MIYDLADAWNMICSAHRKSRIPALVGSEFPISELTMKTLDEVGRKHNEARRITRPLQV